MSEWVSARITAGHVVTDFDCGRELLNDWLRRSAVRADSQGTARTIVCTTPGDPTVLAYYVITPTEVHREGLSSGAVGGKTVVPAYLVAKLAVDRSQQGRGLGTHLLLDALERIVAASETGGGRLVVVDAIDDAASFYRAHGFLQIAGTNRLYVRISALRCGLRDSTG